MAAIVTSEEFCPSKTIDIGRVDTDRIMARAAVSGFPNSNYILCYMNSVIQCVLRCKQFSNPVLHMDPSTCRGKLSVSIYNLIDHLSNQTHQDIKSNTSHVFVRGVYRQLCAISPMFGEDQQQDAQELLLCMVNGVADEFDKGKTEEEKESTPRISFEGRLRTEVVCSTCQHRVPRNEMFMALSIPIGTTIDDGIKSMFQTAHLTGKDRYACENCFKKLSADEQAAHNARAKEQQEERKRLVSQGVKVDENAIDIEDRYYENGVYRDAEVKVSITKLGGSLCVHLLRFQFDPKSMSFKKVTAPVKIPLQVDLTNYVSEEVKASYEKMANAAAQASGGKKSSAPSPSASSNKKFPSVSTLQQADYDIFGDTAKAVPSLVRNLVGIVVHKGSLTGGHYIAYVRHMAQPRVWFRCDDDYVTIVEERQVMECSHEVYLAFYE